MAQFEVFVPASGPGNPNLTLRVQADNWLAALNTGLQKLGETDTSGINLLVDIQDDTSIHVTDPRSGRVFRIQEQAVEAPKAEEPAAAAADPFDPLPPAGASGAVSPAAALSPGSPATPPASDAPPRVPPPSSTAITRGGLTRVTPSRKPSRTAEKIEQIEPAPGSLAASKPIGRSRGGPEAQDPGEVLAELFEKVQSLESETDPEQAMQFLLDLALEKIDAESGSVFLADLSAKDLTVSSARGPKSRELLQMKVRVPMGVGIVGYCAQEGVSLAISDAQKDARFFRAISDRLGYETRSILCSAMLSNGRSFGCIEVMNKKGNNRFEQREVAILSYLSQQAARYLETVG